MENLVKDFLNQKRFAVAGSFRSESKYAYKILKALLNKGYDACPVHPALAGVEGRRCFRSVNDIPFKIDVVNLVTPPLVSEKIVRECRENNIKRIWFQPGAENEDAIRFCRDNDMLCIYGLCVMLESK